jgi:hypothetical protein
MTQTPYSKASCSECPSSFELIPPADSAYNVPKEKPTTEDYIKRIYECDDEKHRNTIFWQKTESFVISQKSRRNVVREGEIGVPIPSGFADY